MKFFSRSLFISLVVFTFLTEFAWAQPENPNNPAPLPGAIILLAAGAAYGAKKYHDSKKEV